MRLNTETHTHTCFKIWWDQQFVFIKCWALVCFGFWNRYIHTHTYCDLYPSLGPILIYLFLPATVLSSDCSNLWACGDHPNPNPTHVPYKLLLERDPRWASHTRIKNQPRKMLSNGFKKKRPTYLCRWMFCLHVPLHTRRGRWIVGPQAPSLQALGKGFCKTTKRVRY